MTAITDSLSGTRYLNLPMKLPNPHLAQITREKIVGYLLNPEHPGNGGKARFFFSAGYDAENWKRLATQFQHIVQSEEVLQIINSPYGRKYIQEGMLQNSDRRHGVRLVWIVDAGVNFPRLVTAYPNEGVNHD